jgi:alpha-L-fucosidase
LQEYEALKTTFNPVHFDPEKWADAARQAGMKYVVFTTKHHDGFSMFDSKYTDYKVTDQGCPFHTNSKANITKEIFTAFRNEGLWTGAYFSKPDWHSEYYWDPYFPPLDRNVNYDPDLYPEKWEKFVQFTHNQILELLTDYGKVDILWLDGGWVAKQDKSVIKDFYTRQLKNASSGFIKNGIVNQDIRMDELAAKARKKQPGLIVVDRAVKGKNQNYLTPENKVPAKALPYPWESCIIAGGGWSWVNNAKYKSSHDLVHMLVDIVCKGGNLLLNIAPGPDGTWHDDAYNRLKDIGEWMKTNSEAIYSTRAIAPYKETKICYTNKKDSNIVYAIYLPEEAEVTLPSLVKLNSFVPVKESKITLLGVEAPMAWTTIKGSTLITVPRTVQQNPPCKHAWVFRINEIHR